MTTERRKMGGSRAGRGRGEGASERKADRFDRGRVKRRSAADDGGLPPRVSAGFQL